MLPSAPGRGLGWGWTTWGSQGRGGERSRRHADFQSAALPTELPGRAYAGEELSGPTGAVGVAKAREQRLAPSPPHPTHVVRAGAGRQCPIGCVWGSAFPMDVAAAEHSGWPNPPALTPFVMS